MIYTVTFSPSVDYIIHIGEIKSGAVNRTDSEQICFGGKGINVSLILAQLDTKSTAMGFTAGFTGDAIEDYLKKSGISTDFVHLDNGFSRINVKIKSGEETEINGRGADIPQEKLDEFFGRLDNLKDGDTLILAGSIPKSVPDDIYERILAYTAEKSVRTVVDAEKTLLTRTLKYKPFLIKPNHIELGEIFGRQLETVDEIVRCARELKAMGAVNVLVSRAEKGAVLVDESGEVHVAEAYSGTVRNSVGAGDSMLAGFIAGYSKGYDYALKLAVASGSATTFCDSLAKKDDIFGLL